MSVLKIALTGGIASGKTTVSQLFAALGVPVIDADIIARELVAPQQPALTLIKNAFGDNIVQDNGELNRVKLRQLIFADKTQREKLEAILHPLIRDEMKKRAESITMAYCILVIPLLIETQQTTWIDRILVVDCPIEIQKKRLKTRDNISDLQIEQIFTAQTTREKRLALADDIIQNNMDLDALKKQVFILHQRYIANC